MNNTKQLVSDVDDGCPTRNYLLFYLEAGARLNNIPSVRQLPATIVSRVGASTHDHQEFVNR